MRGHTEIRVDNYGLKEGVVLEGYQVTGVKYALKHRYSLNGFDMGLGKTLTAIAVANSMPGPCLVVCPAYLKYNWVVEITKFCAEDKVVTLFDKKAELLQYEGAEFLDDFIIINYEQLAEAEYLFKWASLVVVDEAHYLSNDTSGRSLLMDEFVFEQRIPRLLLMTGTPMQNRVEGLYNLLTLLSYEPTNTNGKRILEEYPTLETFCLHFSNKIIKKIRTRKGSRIAVCYRGLRNEGELRTFLKYKYLRFKQEDVLKLPELKHIPVQVCYKNNPKLLEAYEKFLETDTIDVKTKVASAVHSAPFVVKLASDIIDSRGCVVVYSDHREPAKIIYGGLCKQYGEEKVAYIDGETSIKKRNEIVDKFQNGEYVALAATIGAASTGITLTAAADFIFNDENWLPGCNDQAYRRIYRRGQKRSCNIYHTYGSRQAAYIGEQLSRKREDIDKVVDGKGLTK